VDGLIDERAMSRLKWACRRGLLENDLFIQDFFRRHEECLTWRQAEGLTRLMELADNDLLDLLLRRTELPNTLDHPEVSEVLTMLRRPAVALSTEGRTP
jgi:antitoxin CptB